ncbi:MAG: hypothetical protein JXR76_17995 [Deltaproteobacteria bacterium]|nr:hypothetical protein [Deltaproteobacteria bacterium]
MKRARKMLKLELLKDVASKTNGPLVEIVSYPDGNPGGFLWLNGASFNRGDVPIGFNLEDMQRGQPWLDDIRFAVWLFGPTQVKNPLKVYRWLNRHMSWNATFYMATEIPWRGKKPQFHEYGHYADEEIHASLVRSGFERIHHSVDSPYFRIWTAQKSHCLSPELFQRVEEQLSRGNWREAVDALGKLDDKLDSLPAVREYALLLAACHDLAGNTAQAYAALSEVRRLDGDCARALCGLGRLAALDDDLWGALAYFDLALKKSPQLVAALHGRALMCESLGDYTTAYEDLVDASNFRPQDEALLRDVIRLGGMLGLNDELDGFIAERNAAADVFEVSQFLPHMPFDSEPIIRLSC